MRHHLAEVVLVRVWQQQQACRASAAVAAPPSEPEPPTAPDPEPKPEPVVEEDAASNEAFFADFFPTYEKMLTDVPKQKLITPSIISEMLKVTGSLARKAVRELVSKNLIRPILTHKTQAIYTRATNQ